MKAARLELNGLKTYFRWITETHNFDLHVPMMILIGTLYKKDVVVLLINSYVRLSVSRPRVVELVV